MSQSKFALSVDWKRLNFQGLRLMSCMYVIWVLLFVTGCHSKSPDYFLAQGRSIQHELLAEMQQIDDIEGLIEVLPRLERLFCRLAEVMIEAKKWQQKHKASWQPSEEDRLISLELRLELARLYEMPSCRALIEKSQESSLIRLHSANLKN